LPDPRSSPVVDASAILVGSILVRWAHANGRQISSTTAASPPLLVGAVQSPPLSGTMGVFQRATTLGRLLSLLFAGAAAGGGTLLPEPGAVAAKATDAAATRALPLRASAANKLRNFMNLCLPEELEVIGLL